MCVFYYFVSKRERWVNDFIIGIYYVKKITTCKLYQVTWIKLVKIFFTDSLCLFNNFPGITRGDCKKRQFAKKSNNSLSNPKFFVVSSGALLNFHTSSFLPSALFLFGSIHSISQSFLRARLKSCSYLLHQWVHIFYPTKRRSACISSLSATATLPENCYRFVVFCIFTKKTLICISRHTLNALRFIPSWNQIQSILFSFEKENF